MEENEKIKIKFYLNEKPFIIKKLNNKTQLSFIRKELESKIADFKFSTKVDLKLKRKKKINFYYLKLLMKIKFYI